MDNIKFASVVSSITHIAGRLLQDYEVDQLATVMGVANKSQESIKHNMQDLFAALKDSRKIEAIKAYRSLTGASLKDSKDAIESLSLTVVQTVVKGDDYRSGYKSGYSDGWDDNEMGRDRLHF